MLGAGWIFEIPKPALLLPIFTLLVRISRWGIALAYKRGAPPSSAINRWAIIFNIGAGLSGLSWSATAAYLIYVDLIPAAALAAGVAAAMTLCAAVSYAGSIITTTVFAVTALIPSAKLAALRANQIGIMLWAVLIGAFLIAFLCARVVKSLVWESVISYSENEHLVGHLDQRGQA